MLNKNLICMDWIEVNGQRLFPAFDFNAIFKADKNKSQAEILCCCDERKYKQGIAAGTITQNDQRIFFTPLHAQHVFIYDLTNDEILSVSLEKVLKVSSNLPSEQSMNKFGCTMVSENEVIMFGYQYPAIMRIKADTLEISCLTDWLEKIPEEWRMKASIWDGYFGANYAAVGNDIYIPSGIGAGMWRTDYSLSEIEYIQTNCEVSGFFAIANYKDKLVVTSNKAEEGKVFLWDRVKNAATEMPITEKNVWLIPVVYQNDIYLFPGTINGYILHIQGDSLQYERFQRLDVLLEPDEENAPRDYVQAVKQNGSTVSFIRVSDRCWFTYDFESDTLTEKYYELQDEKFLAECNKEYYDEIFESGRSENEEFNELQLPLSEFIKRI